MPINPSGDSIYDGDCLKAKCDHWGGDNLCCLSIEWSIYGYRCHDMKRSFWRHLGWKLQFWKKKYFAEWNISLLEHIRAKLRIWSPKDPIDTEKVPFCVLDSEFREDWEDPDYEEHWDELYAPLDY